MIEGLQILAVTLVGTLIAFVTYAVMGEIIDTIGPHLVEEEDAE